MSSIEQVTILQGTLTGTPMCHQNNESLTLMQVSLVFPHTSEEEAEQLKRPIQCTDTDMDEEFTAITFSMEEINFDPDRTEMVQTNSITYMTMREK